MDYTCNVFAIAVAFASFIIRAEGSFGTEARYSRDNKSRGKRDRLSPRLGEVCETIDCFASRTPFIFSLLVSRSRDIVPPSRHCLTDDINGIRIKGMEREGERESEVLPSCQSPSSRDIRYIRDIIIPRSIRLSAIVIVVDGRIKRL